MEAWSGRASAMARPTSVRERAAEPRRLSARAFSVYLRGNSTFRPQSLVSGVLAI